MIDEILKEFEQIQNWSNAGLTAMSCLAMGYLWRVMRVKWFPNDAIPAVVCITGIFLFVAFSGHGKTQPDISWHVRAGAVGFVIGFVTVLIHNFALKKIEDLLAAKFGVVSSLLNKNEPPPAPPAPENSTNERNA